MTRVYLVLFSTDDIYLYNIIQGHLWDRTLAALKRMCDGYLIATFCSHF